MQIMKNFMINLQLILIIELIIMINLTNFMTILSIFMNLMNILMLCWNTKKNHLHFIMIIIIIFIICEINLILILPYQLYSRFIIIIGKLQAKLLIIVIFAIIQKLIIVKGLEIPDQFKMKNPQNLFFIKIKSYFKFFRISN